MAASYIKASGEPAIVMQAAVVGMANAIGQIFNAQKEQTPLVVYSYRTDQSQRAGRDGFEEVANQEQIVQPITKYPWLARRPDMIPETVRRAFKAAWTPPYGPAYISWHSDYNDERARTEIIAQDQFDPRMRVRPNPAEIARAARLLVEAKMPLLIAGGEITKAKAFAKPGRPAEILGMPVTPALRQKAAERREAVRRYAENAKKLRAQVVDNPDWDQSPLIADRVTWEIAKFADPDAIIVNEAGSVAMHSFDFNPLGGRELFYHYGAHLGSGVGTAAGVKLARPNQQVICLVGDGSFIFGPTALWNMARLELPVITVVYNNHAYGGPHSRVINNVPGGRMVQTGQFVHDYLGSPDMNMAAIAKGFGVDGEVVESPAQLREALARARKHTVEGKPYLIDAQVARKGVAWADKPWIPPIQVAALRQKKV